jgi:hypothetical protein
VEPQKTHSVDLYYVVYKNYVPVRIVRAQCSRDALARIKDTDSDDWDVVCADEAPVEHSLFLLRSYLIDS